MPDLTCFGSQWPITYCFPASITVAIAGVRYIARYTTIPRVTNLSDQILRQREMLPAGLFFDNFVFV